MTPEELIAKVRELALAADTEYNKDYTDRFLEGWWRDAVSELDDLAEDFQGGLDSARHHSAQDQEPGLPQPEQQ